MIYVLGKAWADVPVREKDSAFPWINSMRK